MLNNNGEHVAFTKAQRLAIKIHFYSALLISQAGTFSIYSLPGETKKKKGEKRVASQREQIERLQKYPQTAISQVVTIELVTRDNGMQLFAGQVIFAPAQYVPFVWIKMA